MKSKFSNLEIRFHKRQISFLVVKTVKCKRGISFKILCKATDLKNSSSKRSNIMVIGIQSLNGLNIKALASWTRSMGSKFDTWCGSLAAALTSRHVALLSWHYVTDMGPTNSKHAYRII